LFMLKKSERENTKNINKNKKKTYPHNKKITFNFQLKSYNIKFIDIFFYVLFNFLIFI